MKRREASFSPRLEIALSHDRRGENANSGEPMVVIFSNLISGTGDYFDAYRDFINYATSKGANFVTTMQLVDMAAAKSANSKMSLIISGKMVEEKVNKSETGVIKACPTCDQTAVGVASSIINISVTKSKNCTTCDLLSNNSITNSTATK